ncbi:uncharacterized protein LOC134537934 [Bacillus rossius redtenbacheri]|uniref:uncharacterized protein LOC134537934 n=1 Tax=Bacillus rossius redtenbacheri TaxID=93214 RepID=UPI002FDE921F
MPKVVSVFERAKEYDDEGFYVFSKEKGIMMCKFCNVQVDWKRKDTYEKHCKFRASHKVNKDRCQASGSGTKRQVTLEENISTHKKTKNEKTKLAEDTVRAFVKANIPLQKLNHPAIREWLNEYVKGSGDLPQAHTLRTTYLQSLKMEEEEKVKLAVKDQQVVVLCDETTNRRGECVFVVLFKVLLASGDSKLLVAGVKVLSNANSTECSRAVVETLIKYNVKYENVCAFVSDSAKYMNKCAELLKVLVGENMLYIQCWAHKLNLVGNVWSTELTTLNECVVKAKMAFLNTRKRKHHYLDFLKKSSVEPKLFPSPVLTRWNSWFTSVTYLDKYLVHLVEFFRQQDFDGADATEYFKSLSTDQVLVLQCEAKFVVEYCKKTVDLLECLEGSSYPFAHKLCVKLSDLKTGFKLVSDRNFGGETAKLLNSAACLKAATGAKLAVTGQKSFLKLSSLMGGDPAKSFLENIGFLFNPREIISRGPEIDAVNLQNRVQAVPLLRDITFQKFLDGYAATKHAVLKSEIGKVDMLRVLLSLKNDFPEFSDSAIKCLWLPVSNVDSERAFSAYSNIMSDKRTSLGAENMEIMLAMCFGGD